MHLGTRSYSFNNDCRRRNLYESKHEPPSGIANRLFAITQTLDDGGNKRIEIEFEVVAEEHGNGDQCLQSALRDYEVVVLEKILAAIDELRHL
ncbi:hypothetical protein C1H46_001084 [Malus baccata]|uniref:Uncharacterized protein n=1 Tax=Malus baccata TaxID=106549 RepID=A0A540NQG1_MALBA|nr:hypothetical protein C1H46_001084 [Malus baccata]